MSWDITEIDIVVKKREGENLFANVSIPCPVTGCGGTIPSHDVLVVYFGEEEPRIRPPEDLLPSNLWDEWGTQFKLYCDGCRTTFLIPAEVAVILALRIREPFLSKVENHVRLRLWAEEQRSIAVAGTATT